MPYDRKAFFDTVREELFGGKLTQRQVDGCEHLLAVWEREFEKQAAEQSTPWLAYALATVFHETCYLMVPIEEYGQGEGHEYGEPAGEFGNQYYGRGHVQLTWLDNYQKAQDILLADYSLQAPLVEFPEKMLEDEISALVLYDGMIDGWFTGVGLGDYFNDTIQDPVNARKIVNGLDHAEQIAEYYDDFADALVPLIDALQAEA